MPTVDTMERGLGVSAVVSRTLVDAAPVVLGRSVKLDVVEAGRFRPAGWTFAAGPIERVACCTWVRHDTLTQSATFVHGRSRSTRRCIHFEQGRCR